MPSTRIERHALLEVLLVRVAERVCVEVVSGVGTRERLQVAVLPIPVVPRLVVELNVRARATVRALLRNLASCLVVGLVQVGAIGQGRRAMQSEGARDSVWPVAPVYAALAPQTVRAAPHFDHSVVALLAVAVVIASPVRAAGVLAVRYRVIFRVRCALAVNHPVLPVHAMQATGRGSRRVVPFFWGYPRVLPGSKGRRIKAVIRRNRRRSHCALRELRAPRAAAVQGSEAIHHFRVVLDLVAAVVAFAARDVRRAEVVIAVHALAAHKRDAAASVACFLFALGAFGARLARFSVACRFLEHTLCARLTNNLARLKKTVDLEGIVFIAFVARHARAHLCPCIDVKSKFRSHQLS